MDCTFSGGAAREHFLTRGGLYSPTTAPPMLLIGHADKTREAIANAPSSFLLIADDTSLFEEHFPRAKVFDVHQHSFNPLRGIDDIRAREFAEALYPDKDLMTYRNGKRALTRMFLEASRLDKLPAIKHSGYDDAKETVDDLLLSPIARRVLCNPTNFSFKGVVLARLNRAELGDYLCKLFSVLLIGQVKRHVIVLDGGYHLRDFHTSLVWQERLTVGLRNLSDVSDTLKDALLTIKDKRIYRTSRRDAEELIIYTKHTEPRNLYQQTGDNFELGE